MVLERTVRHMWYIALLLAVTAAHEVRAEDFLSCVSHSLSSQTRQSESKNARAQEIFFRLTHVEAFLRGSDTLHLSIENSTGPNAFVRSSTEVVITTPALEIIENSSELAFILAHELSHIALGHVRPGSALDELLADRLALTLVRRAGFDPCASALVLARLGTLYAASLESLAPRLKALQVSQSASCSGLPLLTPDQPYLPSSASALTVARQSPPELSLAVLDTIIF